MDRDDVEAVVEVLAEAPLGDRGGEVLVGRRDEPHVDPQRLGAADALELALLEAAQQLGLQREAHVADLVEEERPLVGELEAALLLGDGAGERPLLVAEELGLEQRLGDRRAVDLDQRLLGAGAVLVQQVGDQLLAGAALAGDQHGAARRRDLAHDLEDPRERRAAADDLGRLAQRLEAVLEGQVLEPQRLDLERARDELDDLLHAHGLGEVVDGALLERLDGGLHRALAGDDDDREEGVELPEGLEEDQAVHAGHHQVGQDEVGLLRARQLQPLGPRAGAEDGVALVLEALAHRLGGVAVVVGDEDRLPFARLGSCVGEREDHGGALALDALDLEAAAVVLQDLAGQEEPEAAAVLLERRERRREPREGLGRDPLAGVAHRDRGSRPGSPRWRR